MPLAELGAYLAIGAIVGFFAGLLGIGGLAEVASVAYPDAAQFDRKSPYYDAKSSRENPRWMLVDVKLVKKTRLIPLEEMRGARALEDMVTLRRGNRLSITPVTAAQWKSVLKLLQR